MPRRNATLCIALGLEPRALLWIDGHAHNGRRWGVNTEGVAARSAPHRALNAGSMMCFAVPHKATSGMLVLLRVLTRAGLLMAWPQRWRECVETADTERPLTHRVVYHGILHSRAWPAHTGQ